MYVDYHISGYVVRVHDLLIRDCLRVFSISADKDVKRQGERIKALYQEKITFPYDPKIDLEKIDEKSRSFIFEKLLGKNDEGSAKSPSIEKYREMIGLLMMACHISYEDALDTPIAFAQKIIQLDAHREDERRYHAEILVGGKKHQRQTIPYPYKHDREQVEPVVAGGGVITQEEVAMFRKVRAAGDLMRKRNNHVE